ncbi:hypothetical protein ABZ883_08040 [Streptomyces sp. NPDC046977]|uniref:hypothetical protein n=1 Tax=Streptomyces sp. NPDC046977 TaxID=3154703 RepID=UPI0033D719F0
MKELAAGGMPVSVACRVLKLARQPYYRWLDKPVTDAVLEEAHRANALFDAHREDPEFGYRFLADEARSSGAAMADRTAWRICRDNHWWSVFGKKRGRIKKAGLPVHDDLVRRNFAADGPNRLWLADITEHATGEGKLYLCAIRHRADGQPHHHAQRNGIRNPAHPPAARDQPKLRRQAPQPMAPVTRCGTAAKFRNYNNRPWT